MAVVVVVVLISMVSDHMTCGSSGLICGFSRRRQALPFCQHDQCQVNEPSPTRVTLVLYGDEGSDSMSNLGRLV